MAQRGLCESVSLVAILLCACGKSEPPPASAPSVNEFEKICTTGKPLEGWGSPIASNRTDPTSAIAFWKHDGKVELRTFFESDTFDPWRARDGSDLQLVICVEQTDITSTGEVCDYRSDDGTQTKRYRNATLDLAVKIREASTAKVVEDFALHVPPPKGCKYQKSAYDPEYTTWNIGVLNRLLASPYESPDARVGGKPVDPKLTSRDLWIVCSGRAVPSAPAYKPTPGSTHLLAYFEKPGGTSSFEWTIAGAADTTGLSSTDPMPELVACVEHTRDAVISTCPYPDKKRELHATTWHYRLLEARTAKVLLDTKVVASDKACPDPPEGDVLEAYPYTAFDAAMKPFTHP